MSSAQVPKHVPVTGLLFGAVWRISINHISKSSADNTHERNMWIQVIWHAFNANVADKVWRKVVWCEDEDKLRKSQGLQNVEPQIVVASHQTIRASHLTVITIMLACVTASTGLPFNGRRTTREYILSVYFNYWWPSRGQVESHLAPSSELVEIIFLVLKLTLITLLNLIVLC